MAEPKGFTFRSSPPPEVGAYFREKGDRPAFRWSEVWGEEHAHAFTVAKATQLDVLSAIRSSLQKAIDTGTPYEKWARDLKPELERLGWWGRREIADPASGELKDVQLGSPRRLRTIYNANLRSARASGQWERAQRTKAVMPFLVYELGPSIEHRPEHAAKQGLIYAVDDPFWDAWFPPNGWECKCWTRQITRAEAERRGGPSSPVKVPAREYERTRDDGTVEAVRVPNGIDPGWGTNPGKARSETLVHSFTDKLERAYPDDARAALANFWQGSTPEALASLGRRVYAPAAVTPDRIRDELKAEAKVVTVSSDTLAAKVGKHGEGSRGLRPADIGRVQELLDRGTIVESDGRSLVVVARFPDGPYKAVIKRTAEGRALVLSSIFPIEERRARRLLGE